MPGAAVSILMAGMDRFFALVLCWHCRRFYGSPAAAPSRLKVIWAGTLAGTMATPSVLVLVRQYRFFYSLIAGGIVLAERVVQNSATAASVLFAVRLLFHCAEPDQDGAMGVGQHQSPVLLVHCVSAAGGVAAGTRMAAAKIMVAMGCRRIAGVYDSLRWAGRAAGGGRGF